MKKFIPLLLALLFAIAACQADPTVAPGPPGSTTIAPTLPVQATAAPGEPTRAPVTLRAVGSPTPTRPRSPGGAIVIAGVGAPSREITLLPEFVSRGLYDSLLRVNPQTGDLTPGLAQRWLVSEDSKTFVFMLRNDVKWHDGTALTAEDVVFTLQALSNPDIRVNPAADFGPLDQVTATDTLSVSITFREAYCAALTYIGTIPILPRHKLEDKPLIGVTNEDLIGTGPLILENWDEDELTFSRNPNYWGGAPQIVDWTFRAYPTERAAMDAVRQGSADLVVSDADLENSVTVPFVENEFYALALNVKRPPFDDVNVRKAIAFALDRSRFTQQFNGAQLLETGLLPTFWALPPNIAQPKFDIARARLLLTQAGFTDTDRDGFLERQGKPLEVTLWAQVEEPRSETAAQMVRQQLAQVGVRAVLKFTDRTLFLTRIFLQEYDLGLVHFNIPLDPDQQYFWTSSEDDPGFGLNITGYSNDRIDQALAAGNQTARCEPLARKNAYAPVLQQIAQDTPMVFLFAPPRVMNHSPRVEPGAPSPFAGAFWDLNIWQVVE